MDLLKPSNRLFGHLGKEEVYQGRQGGMGPHGRHVHGHQARNRSSTPGRDHVHPSGRPHSSLQPSAPARPSLGQLWRCTQRQGQGHRCQMDHRRQGQGPTQPGSCQRWTPYDRFAGGGGKSSKGGKGAGKGKYQKGSWERRPNMPRLLLGLHYKNTDGRPLCFAWNLPGGCTKGKDGACDRGLHLCSKCLGAHSYNECPQKGPN